MNTKLAVIVAVVVAAVGVLAWQVSSQLGPRKVRSAQSAEREAAPGGAFDDIEIGPDGEPIDGEGRRVEIGGDGPPPAWVTDTPESGIESYSFPKASDAVAVLDGAPSVLTAKFDEDEGAGAVSAGGRQSAVEAWVSFVRPVVADDREGFARVVADFGGVTEPGVEGNIPADNLYGRLNPMLSSSPIALDQARIRLADPSAREDVPAPIAHPSINLEPGAVMMMMMRSEMIDDATGETSSREAVAIPLQLLFPAAAESVDNGAKVVEVWTPAKVKGSGGSDPDLGTSVFLAWNARAQSWQPVALRVTFLSEKGRAKLRAGG